MRKAFQVDPPKTFVLSVTNRASTTLQNTSSKNSIFSHKTILPLSKKTAEAVIIYGLSATQTESVVPTNMAV